MANLLPQAALTPPAQVEMFVPLSLPPDYQKAAALRQQQNYRQTFPLLDKLINKQIVVGLKCGECVTFPPALYKTGKMVPVYHPHVNQVLPGQFEEEIKSRCEPWSNTIIYGTLSLSNSPYAIQGTHFNFTPVGESEPWFSVSWVDLESKVTVHPNPGQQGGSHKRSRNKRSRNKRRTSKQGGRKQRRNRTSRR